MSRLHLRLIMVAVIIVVSVISSIYQTEPDNRPQTPTKPMEVTIETPVHEIPVAEMFDDDKPGEASSSKTDGLAAFNRGVLSSPEEVAVVQHIVQHGTLPNSYITKREADKLGWNPSQGNLRVVAPGKSIGGDRFHNREGELPDAPGRKYFEADLNYHGGHRGAERLVYSSDGLIFVTRDHYRSFQQVKTK